VRELLTDYGPIGLIWFDTPRVITREQSLELAALVHKLQADCIVSGRIGHDAGESSSSGNARTTGSIWDFKVTSPGAYDVVLVSSEQKYGGRWEGGQTVAIDAASQQIKAVVANNGEEESACNAYWPYVLPAAQPESMPAAQKFGITLVSVRLVPTK
jgi:hypothetical protein